MNDLERYQQSHRDAKDAYCAALDLAWQTYETAAKVAEDYESLQAARDKYRAAQVAAEEALLESLRADRVLRRLARII